MKINMAEPTNVYSPLRPEWITDIKGVGYDEDFWAIIKFYLLHSLCDGQSWKGYSLHESYLWKVHPWSPSRYLKDRIIEAIWGDEKSKLYMAKTRALYEGKIFGKDLDDNFTSNIAMQRAGYVKVSTGKNNDNEIMSLFYHIRNGFAHGRFGFAALEDNDYMIFLEDGKASGDQFEVTARIALKKSSLLAIKEILIDVPSAEADYCDEVIASITERGCNTKKQIMEDLDISETVWNRVSQLLKDDGRIEFDKKKWKIK